MYPHKSRLKIDEHTFVPAEPIAVFGDPVVRLDLGRPGVVLERTAIGDERPGIRPASPPPAAPRRWALVKLPTAPFHLPRMLTAAQRRCARRRRATKLANSLPRVVGLTVVRAVARRHGGVGGSDARAGQFDVRALSVPSSVSRAACHRQARRN